MLPVRRFIALAVLLALAIPAHGLNDTFTTYKSNYKVLDDTPVQGWQGAYDSDTLTSDALMKNGGSALRVHVNNQFLVQWNVPARRTGELGLESYKGTSNFQNFTFS